MLGGRPDGSEDAVIEVNPRLTTCYVALRQLARVNLAAAVLTQAIAPAGGSSGGAVTGAGSRASSTAVWQELAGFRTFGGLS